MQPRRLRPCFARLAGKARRGAGAGHKRLQRKTLGAVARRIFFS